MPFAIQISDHWPADADAIALEIVGARASMSTVNTATRAINRRVKDPMFMGAKYRLVVRCCQRIHSTIFHSLGMFFECCSGKNREKYVFLMCSCYEIF